MGGSVWELPTQPQKGVIIASDLEPALLNQWAHIPLEGPPLPHSTAKHFGGMQPQYLSSPGPTRTRPPGQNDRFGPRSRLSVEGESTSGSCSTSRNDYIGVSVVQVRMASPGCLTDGCPNVPPTNLDC